MKAERSDRTHIEREIEIEVYEDGGPRPTCSVKVNNYRYSMGLFVSTPNGYLNVPMTPEVAEMIGGALYDVARSVRARSASEPVAT